MPDVHFGIGATVGSVVPTKGAIIPAAVGVDIGCGMMAVETDRCGQRPAGRARRRCARRSKRRCRMAAPRTAGAATAARGTHPARRRRRRGRRSRRDYKRITDEAPARREGQRRSAISARSAPATTSSRSVSTKRIACGSCCTRARAASATASARTSSSSRRSDMQSHVRQPARQAILRTSTEGSRHFADYVEAVEWAQRYALENRKLMMDAVLAARARALPASSSASTRSTATTTTSRASTTSARTCS